MEYHRNYMSTFRSDVSWSSLYAIKEQGFLTVCDDKSKDKPLQVFKMLKKEKELLDTFTYAVNNGLMWNHGNVDKDGKPTIHEPDTNRPIDFLRIAA